MPLPRKAPQEPDPQTLAACRAGDPAALERVFREQLPVLERLLARLLGPDPDREDVLQQVLLAAVAAFPAFRGEASVRTWLAGIAIRTVRQHWRQGAPRRRVPLELVPEPEGDPGQGPGPLLADQREGIRRLYEHLEALSERKRIAFVLHVLEGRSIAEVAALMEATLSATKSRVFFARRELVKRARRDPLLSSLVQHGQGEGER
ncbi:MAG: RNA polymerase sigma factor [Deltaproteobacteria bacterium]|nr:RNA polymerase sigma factor [Deltaproteobacteria bacterium]